MDWRGVAVAGLVLVAGCNGIAFGDDARSSPTETVTPVPIEAIEGTRATAAPNAPPGVSMDGSVDLSALLAAHHAYVNERIDSYTWVARAERTLDSRNISGRNYTRRLRTDGDAFTVEHVHGDGRNVTLYASGSRGYLRTVSSGQAEVRAVEDPSSLARYSFAEEMIRQFLREDGVSVRKIERDGQVLYRVHSNRPGPQMGGASFRDAISNYTATAYVTPAGFVRTMVVDFDQSLDGLARHTFLRFDYSAVGETSVPRPAWVDQVPAQAESTTTAAPATAGPTPTATPAPANATTSEPATE